MKSEKLKVKNPCVWIVVHRRELVEQIKETLNATHNVECEMLNVNESKPLDSSFFTLHLLRQEYSFSRTCRHLHHHRLIRTKCRINPFLHFCVAKMVFGKYWIKNMKISSKESEKYQ